MERRDGRVCGDWDRLLLLLAARAREGFEREFELLIRREFSRLFSVGCEEGDDE